MKPQRPQRKTLCPQKEPSHQKDKRRRGRIQEVGKGMAFLISFGRFIEGKGEEVKE